MPGMQPAKPFASIEALDESSFRDKIVRLKSNGKGNMDQEAHVAYWVDSADRDFATVERLFVSGDYSWTLFIGHLVLEKLFKALYVQRRNEMAPRIHDLARLAERCGLSPEPPVVDQLELISRFNLAVRYPDERQDMYRLCTRDYTESVLDSIREIRSWLQTLLRKS